MIAWTLWTALATAHALAPAGLDLTLVDPTHARVDWRTPIREPNGESLHPVWPPGCALVAGDPTPDEAGALVLRGTLTCAAPIVGGELGVDGLVGANVDVVVTVRGDGGRVRRTLLHDPVSRWTIAEPDQTERGDLWRRVSPDLWRQARAVLAFMVLAASVEGVHRVRRTRWPWLQVVGWVAGVGALVWWWCA